MKKIWNYFTKFEKLLWLFSILSIIISFVIFDRSSYLSLVASLIGVTALIFSAKGNPIGPGMMVVFSILYAYISFSFSYYGEMITYLCMTLPMSVFTLFMWLKNSFNGNKAEVKISHIKTREVIFATILTIAVTVGFYFILAYFNTANLIPSTLSITTSFAAVYLSARRSPAHSIWYTLNDLVLVVLWFLATLEDVSYVSVTVCFIVFLLNDMNVFFSWLRIEKRQKSIEEKMASENKE